MRSNSQERRQQRYREPQGRLAPQVFALATSRSSQDLEHVRLHSRLKTVVGKMMDFVSISSELLTASRLPDNSLVEQRRLLEEVEQEQERWQQQMSYVLSVHEDVLSRCSKRRLSDPSTSLGSSPSDFKRITDLIAEAQNKVSALLKKRRDDSSISNKVWEVFTALVQRVYETFFRKSHPESEELEHLRGRLRATEVQVVEASALLKSKELEIQSLQRSQGSRHLANAHHAFELETELQHARDRIRHLEEEAKRLREVSEPPFKYEPVRRSVPDDPLSSPRSLARNVQELSRIMGEREVMLKELLELRAWKQRKLADCSIDEIDLNAHATRSPECTNVSTPRQIKTPLRTSPSPMAEDSESLKIYLSREREKSNSFFSQLRRKEKDVSELQKMAAMLKAEVEHLREVEVNCESKVKRQQEEISKFLSLIKALEEDKEQAYALVQQHYRDKLKAERELSALHLRLPDESESLMKQLRVVLEEKQQLARSLSDAQAGLARASDHAAELQKAEAPKATCQRPVAEVTQKMEAAQRKTERALEEAEARLMRATQSWPRLAEKVRSLMRQLAAERTRNDETETLLGTAKHEVTVAATTMRTIEAQLRAKEAALEQLAGQQGLEREHMVELKRENNSLSQALEALKDLQEAVSRAEAEAKHLRDSLEQQTHATEREAIVAKEAKDERDEQVKRAQQLSEALATVSGEKKQLERKAEQLEDEVRRLASLDSQRADRDYEILREQFASLGDKYESASLQLAEKIEEGESLAAELTRKTEELAHCSEQLGSLRSQIEGLQTRLKERDAAMTSEISAARREAQQRTQQAEEARSRAEEGRSHAEAEKTKLASRLTAQEADLHAITTKFADAKNAGGELTRQLREMEQVAAAAEKGRSELQRVNDEQQELCAKERAEAETCRAKFAQELEEVRSALAEKSRQTEQLAEECRQLQSLHDQEVALRKQEKAVAERRKVKTGNLKQQQTGLQEILEKQGEQLERITAENDALKQQAARASEKLAVLGLTLDVDEERVKKVQCAAEEFVQIAERLGTQSALSVLERVAELEKANERLKEELRKDRELHSELQAQARAAELKVTRLLAESARLSEGLQSAKQQAQETAKVLTDEKSDLQQRLKNAQQKLASTESALTEAQEKTQELENKLKQAQQDHGALLNSSELKVSALDQHVQELNSEMRTLAARVAQEQRTNSDLTRTNADLSSEVLRSKQVAEDLKQSLSTSQKRTTELQASLAQAEEALSAARLCEEAGTRTARERQEAAERRANDLRSQVESLQQQTADLHRQQHALAQQTEDLRKQHQHALAQQAEDLRQQHQHALAQQTANLHQQHQHALAQQTEAVRSLLAKEVGRVEKALKTRLTDMSSRVGTLQSKVETVAPFASQRLRALTRSLQHLQTAAAGVGEQLREHSSRSIRVLAVVDQRLTALASRAVVTFEASLQRCASAGLRTKVLLAEKDRAWSELPAAVTETQTSLNSSFRLLTRIISELENRLAHAVRKLPALKQKVNAQTEALYRAHKAAEQLAADALLTERNCQEEVRFAKEKCRKKLAEVSDRLYACQDQLSLVQEENASAGARQEEASQWLEVQLSNHAGFVASLLAALDSRVVQLYQKLTSFAPVVRQTAMWQVEQRALAERVEALQSENAQLADSLTHAHRRIEDLEQANESLRAPPTVSEIVRAFQETSRAYQASLQGVQTRLVQQDGRLLHLARRLQRLRPCIGNRSAIRTAFKETEEVLLRHLRWVGASVSGERRLQSPEVELYQFAMEIADQVETLVVSRLEGAEGRLERLAHTVETVINTQCEEIDHLRLTVTGGRLSESSNDVLDRDLRLSAISQTLEGVLGTATHFTVCKRVSYQNEVWCLVRVEDEERELYWWREEHLKQLDTRSEYWPALEEEVLQRQVQQVTMQLQQMQAERDALHLKAEALQYSLETPGVNSQRSLSAALQELLSRVQKERLRTRDLPSCEGTVMTESTGENPTFGSSEAELAPLIETLARLTEENEEQSKLVADLNKQIEVYKEALRRDAPPRRPDKLTAAAAGVLEVLPEQTPAAESQIEALLDQMLLSREEKMAVRDKRAALGKEEKKAKSSWLSWR